MDALALRLDARYPEFEALERKLKENHFVNCNCPGCGLGSEQAEGIRQGCRIAGQGVDDGPALLLGG